MPITAAPSPARRARPRGKLALAAALLLAGAARGAALAPGDIVVTDSLGNVPSNSRLVRIDPGTGAATELASAGFLLNPIGVDVDLDGFAFVTNVGSQLVVRIEPGAVSPAPVQVLISALANVRGIVLDPGGDAFVSSPTTDEIIRVDTVTGTSTPASAHGLIQFPTGLVREPGGDLVVADSSSLASRILRIDPDDGAQTLLSSGGMFQVLRDIEIDPTADCSSPLACSFLVIDSGARKVFRVDATIPYDEQNPGANQSEWAACPGFLSPRGIAVEPGGSVLVSDFTAKKVFRIQQTPVPRVCSELATGSALLGPWDVDVVGALSPFVPGPLLVADSGSPDQVLRVAPATGTGAAVAGSAGIVDPVAVIHALNDDLFVLTSDRILRLTPGGVQTQVTSFTAPVDLTGIAIDANGELLVTDAANHRLVRVIPGTGTQIVVADDDGMPPALLADPRGLALDVNGTALVANGGRSDLTPAIPTAIVRVNPISGTTTTVTNDPQFGKLVGVAVDSNGDYLIADEGKDTVWRFRASTPANTILYPVSVGNDIVSLRGIAVDVNRSVVVSNQGPKEILRLDPVSGAQSEVAPLLAFTSIQGLALDQAPSPAPLDSDNDGVLEAVDNCPELANADQADFDSDGVGDVCDGDFDGDGLLNTADNCRLVPNADQTDTNSDGYGNLCDSDYDNLGVVDGVDFSRFKAAYLSSTGDPAYDADIDADSDGSIDGQDFSVFKSLYLRAPGPSGLTCAGTIPCP
jgi:streptogramin lyase